MAKKKKKVRDYVAEGLQIQKASGKFSPTGTARQEFEEEEARAVYSANRVANQSLADDTRESFNKGRYQSGLISTMAKSANGLSIPSSALESYEGAQTFLASQGIDPSGLMKQKDFLKTSQQAYDKKFDYQSFIDRANELNINDTIENVRKSYNDIEAVKKLGTTRNSAEQLLKDIDDYERRNGKDSNLDPIKTRAKDITDYINNNASGGSAAGQKVKEVNKAPYTKSPYDTSDTLTKPQVEAKYQMISDENLEEKYGKPGNIGYEGLKKIKPETKLEEEWVERNKWNQANKEYLKKDYAKANEEIVKLQQEREELDNPTKEQSDISAKHGSNTGLDAEGQRQYKAIEQDKDNRKAEIDKRLQELTNFRDKYYMLYGVQDEMKRYEKSSGKEIADLLATKYDKPSDPTRNYENIEKEYLTSLLLDKEDAEETYNYIDDKLHNDYLKRTYPNWDKGDGSDPKDADQDEYTAYRSLQLQLAAKIGGDLTDEIRTDVALSEDTDIQDKYKDKLAKFGERLGNDIYEAAKRQAEGDISRVEQQEATEEGKESPIATIPEGVWKRNTGGLEAFFDSLGQRWNTTFNQSESGLDPVDFNSDAYRRLKYGQSLQEGGASGIDNEHAKSMYNAVNSTADMALATLESSPLLLTNLVAPGVGTKLTQDAVVFIMGTQAGASSMLEAHEQGMSDREAVQYGLASAFNETLGEKISIDQILKVSGGLKRGLKNFVKTAGKSLGASAVAEGSEEVATDLLNRLYDNMAHNKDSLYNRQIREYQKQGLTKNAAKQKVDEEFISQLGSDFEAGALAGLLMGGSVSSVNTAINKIQDAKTTRDVGSIINTNLEQGNLSDEDLDYMTEVGMKSSVPEINEQAIKIKDKIDNGQSVSNMEIGSLSRDLIAANEGLEVETPTVSTPQSILEQSSLPKDAKETMISKYPGDEVITPRMYENDYRRFYTLGKSGNYNDIGEVFNYMPEYRDVANNMTPDAAGVAFQSGLDTYKSGTKLEQIDLNVKPTGKVVNDIQDDTIVPYTKDKAKRTGLDFYITDDIPKYLGENSKSLSGEVEGFTRLAKGRVFVNPKVGNALTTIEHEIAENIKNLIPEKFAPLEKFMVTKGYKVLGTQKFEDVINNYKNAYPNSNDTELRKEYVCDMFATLMTSDKGIELFNENNIEEATKGMTEDEKKSFIEVVKEVLSELVTKLKAYMESKGVKPGTEFVTDETTEGIADIKTVEDAIQYGIKLYDNLKAKIDETTVSEGSVDNDVRYSVNNEVPDVLDESGADVDDKGRKLTKDQVEYFKNSKVRLDGDLETTYHGTVSDFTVFDRQFANVEGDWGKGYYFTNDINDVERNYANEEGADLTIKIERRAEQLEYNEDLGREESLARARKEFIKSDAKYIEAYLNITNPVYIDKAHPTLLLEDWEDYLTYDRSEYESDEDYWEGAMQDIDENLFVDIANDLENNIGITSEESSQAIGVLSQAIYEGGITAQDLKDKINDLYIDDDNGDLVGNEIARQIIESLGYDGIIDYTVSDKFKNMGLHPDVTHFIVFNSNQAKNVDNKTPTENDDIRYSKDERKELQKEINKLKRENDKYKYAYEMLEREFKRTSQDHKISSIDINKTSNKLKSELGSTIPYRTLNKSINQLYKEIYNRGNNIQNSDINAMARSIIRDMLDYVEVKNNVGKGVLEQIKGSEFRLSQAQKNEIAYKYGDFNKWRNKHKSYFTVSDDAKSSIDQMWYDEWLSDANPYANVFAENGGEELSDKDIAIRLTEIIDNAINPSTTALEEQFNMTEEDIISTYALELLNEYITTPESQTLTDTIWELKQEQKDAWRRAYKEGRAQGLAERRAENLVEREKRREAKLNKDVKAVWDKIQNQVVEPTFKDKGHLTPGWAKAVAEFSQVIDFENAHSRDWYITRINNATQAYENAVRNDTPDKEQLKQNLNKWESMFENFNQRAAAKAKALSNLLNTEQDGTVENEVLKTRLDDFIASVDSEEGIPYYRLSMDQKQDLLTLGRMILHENEKQNRIRGKYKFIDRAGNVVADVSDLVAQANEEAMDTKKPKSQNPFRTFFNSLYTPQTVFDSLGGNHKDNIMLQLWQMVDDAQEDEWEYQKQTLEILDPVLKETDKGNRLRAELEQRYNNKNLVDIGVKGKDADGNEVDVKLPRGMVLELLTHISKPQNLKHIAEGGLTVPDFKGYYNADWSKAYGSGQVLVSGISDSLEQFNIRIAQALEDGNTELAERLSDEKYDLQQWATNEWLKVYNRLKGELTEYESRVLDAMEKTYQKSGALMGEVSNAMYGVNLFDEINGVADYYPISVDPAYLGSEIDYGANVEANLGASGFAQKRVNSKKPLLLGDIFVTTSNHLNKTSKYYAYLIPQHNMNAVLNGQVNGYENNLKKTLQMRDKGKLEYIETWKKDMFGGRGKDNDAIGKGTGKAMSWLRSNYAAATLNLNAKVALYQPLSYFMALTSGGAKNTIKGLVNAKQSDLTEMINEATNMLWARDYKGGMVETETLKANKSALAKAIRWADRTTNGHLDWIHNRDIATVTRLGGVAKAVLEEEGITPETEEWNEEFARVYKDLMRTGQPQAMTAMRPEIQRSNSEIVKFIAMFYTVRLQMLNTCIHEVSQYKQFKQDYKNGKYGVTEADVKEQKGRAVRAIVGTVLSQAAVVAVAALIQALLYHQVWDIKDEDGEVTPESIVKGFGKAYSKTMAEMIPLAGEIYDTVDYYIQKSSGGYADYDGLQLNGLDVLTDLVKNAVDTAVKLKNNNLTSKDILKEIEYLGKVVGVPLGNIMKPITGGLMGAIEDANDNGAFDFSDLQTDSQRLTLYFKDRLSDEESKQVLSNTTSQKITSAAKKLYQDGTIDAQTAIDKMKQTGLYKPTEHRKQPEDSYIKGKIEWWNIEQKYKDDYINSLDANGNITAETKKIISQIAKEPYSNAFWNSPNVKPTWKSYKSPYEKLYNKVTKWKKSE